MCLSPEEKYISVYGDLGQAERLVSAKRYNQSAHPSSYSYRCRGLSNRKAKRSFASNTIRSKVLASSVSRPDFNSF